LVESLVVGVLVWSAVAPTAAEAWPTDATTLQATTESAAWTTRYFISPPPPGETLLTAGMVLQLRGDEFRAATLAGATGWCNLGTWRSSREGAGFSGIESTSFAPIGQQNWSWETRWTLVWNPAISGYSLNATGSSPSLQLLEVSRAQFKESVWPLVSRYPGFAPGWKRSRQDVTRYCVAPGKAEASSRWEVYVGRTDSFAVKYNRANRKYMAAGWTNRSDGSWCLAGRRSQKYYPIRGREKFFGEGYPKPIRSTLYAQIVWSKNRKSAYMDLARTATGDGIVRVEGRRSYDANTLKYMKRLATRCS
jgi:hypothetical protein